MSLLDGPLVAAGFRNGSRHEPTENDDPRNRLIDAAVGTVEAVASQDAQVAAALIARLQGLLPKQPAPARQVQFDALALAAIQTALRVVAGRRLSEADHLCVAHAKQLVAAAMGDAVTTRSAA